MVQYISCKHRKKKNSLEKHSNNIPKKLIKVFLNVGDIAMVNQCLKLALAYDPHHAESFNNLGVKATNQKKNSKRF